MAAEFASGADGPVSAVRRALAKAAASQAIFIALREESALREAAAAAARRAEGRPLGPLDGIPIAIKDNIDVAGMVTTAGARIRSGNPPAKTDAPVVAALRREGMIVIGKTNLSEFAFSGLGLNPHFGTPTADFGKETLYAPGGSSAGSAIAVQRGIVPVALGTDTAGSIRIPAAFNGLVGFKSSSLRYDRSGVFPLALTLDSLGPIAPTVVDCVLLDAAMRGRTIRLPPSQPLSQIDLAVDEETLHGADVEPAVRDNLIEMMHGLERVGARVRVTKIFAFRQALGVIKEQGWLGAIEAASHLGRIVAGPEADSVDRRIRARLQSAAAIGDETRVAILKAREQLAHAIADDLQGAILVTPTVAHGAPELAPLEGDDALFARINLATLALTMPGSLLDMPGLALPSGVNAAGLPTSVLLSLPRGGDDALLRAGVAIEVALHNIAGHG
ncbi:glutamyl-tRNA amidotransferase [Methylovirgula sp. 4M-Z18]|nr:glutamyl-tRNA amidotransferase [Methylovirgula sp. 4M-Z18]